MELDLPRNPNEPAYLTNSQSYILVDSSGNPITSGNGIPESYAQYYAHLGQTPPAPNAPFFGKMIQPTTTNGMTTYAYATDASHKIIESARLVPYQPNAGNPNTFGALSYSTNQVLNNVGDPATNFGQPNTPFTTTPGTLFTLTSTARYLDYRTGFGPNGNTPVTVQQMDSSGQFQTVNSNGLIPYFAYDLPTTNAATNDFSSPNSGDLGISMMDLGGPISGPYVNPTGVDANDLQLYSYSDDAATMTWGDSNLGRFNVTMSETSPFSQFTYTRGSDTNPLTLLLRNNDISGLNPIIDTATYDQADNAILITGYSQPNPPGSTGMQVIQDPNVLVKVFYAIYLPTGFPVNSSTFVSNLDGGNALPNNNPPQVPLFGAGANDVLLSVPSNYGTAANPFHFVIAALPSPDAVSEFRDYAFNYITGSTNTLSYNSSTNQVGLTVNVTTQNCRRRVDQAGCAPGDLSGSVRQPRPEYVQRALSDGPIQGCAGRHVSYVVNALRQYAAAARAHGHIERRRHDLHKLLDGLRR